MTQSSLIIILTYLVYTNGGCGGGSGDKIIIVGPVDKQSVPSPSLSLSHLIFDATASSLLRGGGEAKCYAQPLRLIGSKARKEKKREDFVVKRKSRYMSVYGSRSTFWFSCGDAHWKV